MLLSSFHYEILQYISDHEYISGTELESIFSSRKRRYLDSIQFFLDQKLVHYSTGKNDEEHFINKPMEDSKHFSFNPSWHLFLTEYGYSILETYQKEKQEFELLKKQVSIDNCELQVQKESLNHVKAESANNRKDVRISQIMSIIAILISFSSFVFNLIHA